MKEVFGVIYKLTNIHTGKSYVGQTTNPKNRYKSHFNHKGRHRVYNDPNDHSKGWKMVY